MKLPGTRSFFFSATIPPRRFEMFSEASSTDEAKVTHTPSSPLSELYNSFIMKRLSIAFLTVCTLSFGTLYAQEEEEGLKISGSVDTYYKYDFSGTGNIPTSFADEQNSISIGMIDLVLEKSAGKASFVGEIAFGPRNFGSAGPASGADALPLEEGDDPVFASDFAPRIQNLYVSYALTDQISLTGGYMGTFVGYEIISPTGNFNYSTSYLFTNGPFQNAGLKLDYAINDKLGVMVGVFNPWNTYSADPEVGPSSFGAQVYVSPVDGWDAYINFVTGGESGTEIDLTTTYEASDDLLIGLNVASYSGTTLGADSAAAFTGAALYLNYGLSDNAAIGLRAEHFVCSNGFGALNDFDGSVTALTLSGNLTAGDLTFIPEIRYDFADTDAFFDSNGAATSSATQLVLAAVYAF